MRRHLALLEQALDAFVAPGAPPDLAAAMRYGVLGGGKRLRALLVLAGQQCVAAATPDGLAGQELALRAGCAVELIHAYSLIHDDMPCMDNDVLRRGKPTVHVQFGEAAALLAGDAMQALAFELLTPGAVEHDGEPAGPHSTMDAALVIQARLCATLARAAGPCGMAGGQAIDLAHVGKPMAADALRRMHRLKTGALLQASVVLGAQCVPQASAQALTALSQYGSAIGLAFQVVDDVLDATADSATLGKTAGKDAADEKPTYVSLMGVEAAQAYAGQLHAEALAALAASGLADTRLLGGLADLVVRRRH
ncbi:polyprenyl synthetase family protein [Corticibacter populi]|uniref:Polyprenyl synthetase family protein n=1 Tax=Corticibacter populi TaxID=1550736 RepID=A0A3M6QYF2_9BURK|nr:farnesyl diphosphate synthase [Corticibacter populi]RMX08047.1 polyprenyl synthetase family protein [Corticibacter populi]